MQPYKKYQPIKQYKYVLEAWKKKPHQNIAEAAISVNEREKKLFVIDYLYLQIGRGIKIENYT